MSTFAERATALNDAILSRFGESVVIRQGVQEWPSVLAAFAPPNAGQMEWPSGFVQAQFRRSDAPGVRPGATVVSASAEYRVVEVDQQAENWTIVKLQKVRDLSQ